MSLTKVLLCGFVGGFLMTSQAFAQATPSGTPKELGAAEKEFTALLDAYVARLRPLFIKSVTAWWEANTTGADAAFERRKQAQNELVELHSDKAVFAKLKALKEGGAVTAPLLARQLEVVYRSFLAGQADPELQKKIIALENEVEQTFNTHRSDVNGKQMTENDVRKILSDSKDPKEVEAAWKGYMAVGAKIDPKLRMVIGFRNQLAKQLGFRNYFTMKLSLQELDEAELLAMFDELDSLTREPFAALKLEIDKAMAVRFAVKPEELRPWHFGDLFFQEAPGMESVNLDDLFKDKDLLELARTYFAGIGLPVDDILARSDLYEKPGKCPHAFCESLDRDTDIRLLCNLKNNAYWADTLMHELGHAVYDKYISKDVPFVLHEASHSMTTEGCAMMFGAMTKNEDFLTKALKLSPAEAAKIAQSAKSSLRAEKLIFSRWSQVMLRFERGMYENPDQNLGELWWKLKRQYQLLNPPETTDRPDYAAKIHVVTVPAYYHNYMLGELFACQLHAYLAKSVVGVDDPGKTSYYGKESAGDFLRQKVFAPGNLHPWKELIKLATGEPLSAKAFARLYVQR